MLHRRLLKSLPQKTLTQISPFSTSARPAIKIPKRIKRSPTDILEALAKATVIERDPTNPGPGILDDPFGIPTNRSARDNMLLSKESGRRAARQLAAQWPTLFQYNRDEPRLDAFRKYSEAEDLETIDSEEKLKKLIAERNIELAGKGYEKLREDGVECTLETQEDLLELLCFYNSQPDESLVEGTSWEERTLRGVLGAPREKGNWNNNGIADIVFEEIEAKSPRVYSAMICGMATYFNQHERAEKLFAEMLTKKMTPSVYAFNALINSSYARSKKNDDQWKMVMAYLEDMKELNIPPNLGTFNAVLESISKMTRWPHAEENALKILQEMIASGIEPSLYSYMCLINIYRPDAHKLTGLIQQILAKLEAEIGKKETDKDATPFAIRHEKDIKFFSDSMRVIFEMNLDRSLADRLYALYNPMTGDDLIPIMGDRDSFYKFYVALSAEDKPTEEFMEIFDSIVPGLLSFDFVYSEFQNHIRENKCYEHLRKLVVYSRVSGAINRMASFRTILVLLGASSDIDNLSDQLKEDIVRSVEDLYEFLDSQEVRSQGGRQFLNIPWTGAIITDLAVPAARCGDLALARKILEKFDVTEPNGAKPLDEEDETHLQFKNRPHDHGIQDLTKIFFENEDHEMAIKTLTIGVKHGCSLVHVVEQYQKKGVRLTKYLLDELKSKEGKQNKEKKKIRPQKLALGLKKNQ